NVKIGHGGQLAHNRFNGAAEFTRRNGGSEPTTTRSSSRRFNGAAEFTRRNDRRQPAPSSHPSRFNGAAEFTRRNEELQTKLDKAEGASMEPPSSLGGMRQHVRHDALAQRGASMEPPSSLGGMISRQIAGPPQVITVLQWS